MEPFPTVVVLATDGSDDARLAERAAIDLCARSGALLHVAHAWMYVTVGAYPHPVSAPIEVYQRFQEDAEAVLTASVERIGAAGGVVAGRHLRLGSPAGQIAALADELDADLIVIGSRGLGPIRRLVLGSVSTALVHEARRPTLVLRGDAQAWPPLRVVVGADGSAAACRAAEFGAALGRSYDAAVTLARVVPELSRPRWYKAGERVTLEQRQDQALDHARQALAESARHLLAGGGGEPQIVAVAGDAAPLLLELAEVGPAPTLLAIGSRSLGPLDRLRLGSVSNTLLHAAHGPILVVPGT